MKRLLHLFLLYILLLSGIPCQADDGCCQDEVNTAATHHKNNLPDDKPTQPCSPFFACGACHGFIIPEIATTPTKSVQLDKRPITCFINHYLGDFSPSTWDPPKQA